GKQGRLADAKGQLKDANKFANDNPFTYYNIGMVYADLKQYEEALGMAHKAYQMGFQQPGLRDRLAAVGKWQDAPKGR
ncbi:MAG: tetratricopeptide repeat protein, partial [Burkholderiaceae bacterium]